MKQHVEELCEIANCKSKACSKRHPKVCKFFTQYNRCRYNEKCAYSHTATKEKGELAALLVKVDNLENNLKFMSEKVVALEEKIQNIDSESKSSTSKTFKCDQCDYKASKNSILKRHVTSKHKSVISALEQERSIALDDSLQLELPVQERENETHIDSPPKATEHIPPISLFKCDLCTFEGTHSFALEAHLSFIHNEIISKTSSSVHFKCDICKHESISEAALHGHKSLKHDIKIPHTSQWDKKKCHICNNVFTETTLFKNHMIKQHGFSDEHSDECMNCESTEVGDYRPVPSQHIFMNCKNCELLEAES